MNRPQSSGGNGGGGICAARHLANHGARVSLCLAAPERLGEVPAYQHKIFQATAGTEIAAERIGELHPALILDALIGYSLRSAPRGVVEALMRWANESGAPMLSLDVPSGVDATSGEAPGEYIRAGCTLTLALPKTGLGSGKAGEMLLADIGIPEMVYRRLDIPYVNPFDRRYCVPLKRRGRHS